MSRPEIVTNWSGLLRPGHVWDENFATPKHTRVDRKGAGTSLVLLPQEGTKGILATKMHKKHKNRYSVKDQLINPSFLQRNLFCALCAFLWLDFSVFLCG